MVKLVETKIEILQSVGVKQGDTNTTLLYLFLMTEIMQLLGEIWKKKTQKELNSQETLMELITRDISPVTPSSRAPC